MLLETAANLWASWDKTHNLFAPFSRFELGGITKHLMTSPMGYNEFCFPSTLGKQNSLFPSASVIKCLLFQQKSNWFHRQAILNFFMRKTSSWWSNQAGKITLRTSQFSWCPALNETLWRFSKGHEALLKNTVLPHTPKCSTAGGKCARHDCAVNVMTYRQSFTKLTNNRYLINYCQRNWQKDVK